MYEKEYADHRVITTNINWVLVRKIAPDLYPNFSETIDDNFCFYRMLRILKLN